MDSFLSSEPQSKKKTQFRWHIFWKGRLLITANGSSNRNVEYFEKIVEILWYEQEYYAKLNWASWKKEGTMPQPPANESSTMGQAVGTLVLIFSWWGGLRCCPRPKKSINCQYIIKYHRITPLPRPAQLAQASLVLGLRVEYCVLPFYICN